MGRGARPPKAHSLPLKTSLQAVEAAPTVSTGTPAGIAGAPAAAVLEAALAPPPTPTPASPAPTPVSSDLATLQALKEQLRQQHPDWYPDFRDTFGNQLTEKLLPAELAQLSAAELGLSPGLVSSDPDRLRRELRALAFARSYLMAEAGDLDGLNQVSEDLAYFWNDRLEGKLIPLPPIDPNDPVPWVHAISQLHSRHTSGLESKYGKQARYRSFVHAVKDWTDGRWRALRTAAKKVLNGEHGGADHAKARELIQGIDSAPNNAPRLWHLLPLGTAPKGAVVRTMAWITHVFEPPGQQKGTLSRLQTAHEQLIGCIRQLQAERDLAQPQSNWRRSLDQLVHRLETDDELLFGLAEETLARLNRRSGT